MYELTLTLFIKTNLGEFPSECEWAKWVFKHELSEFNLCSPLGFAKSEKINSLGCVETFPRPICEVF